MRKGIATLFACALHLPDLSNRFLELLHPIIDKKKGLADNGYVHSDASKVRGMLKVFTHILTSVCNPECYIFVFLGHGDMPGGSTSVWY